MIENELAGSENNKVDYAILSAMPEELEFVIERFSKNKYVEKKIGDLNFKIYDYQNKKILISHTGIGIAFAASFFTLVHCYFRPNYFLISGTAGAIHKDLKINDVVVVEKAFEAEIQDLFVMIKNTPFESCLVHPVKNQNFPAQFSANPKLLKICDTLNFADLRIHKGIVVSSNAFPAPKELFEKIKQFDPYSIDMETSAFYQIAWLLNAKVLAIRGISNMLNSDGTDDNVHIADVEGSSRAAARVLLAVLDYAIALKI